MMVSTQRNIYSILMLSAFAVFFCALLSCKLPFNTKLLTDVTQKARFAPEPTITLLSPAGTRNFYLTTETLQYSITSSLPGAVSQWRTNEETTYSTYSNPINRTYAGVGGWAYDIYFYAYSSHPDFNSSGETYLHHRFMPSGVLILMSGNASLTPDFSGDTEDSRWAAYNSPTAIISYNGFTYIADTGNNRIRRIHTDGTILTILGDGTQGNALTQVNTPTALAIDTGSPTVLYVSDSGNARILKISNPESASPSTTLLNISSISVGSTPRTLTTPGALAFRNATLYIADINPTALGNPAQNRILSCIDLTSTPPTLSVVVDSTTVRGITTDSSGRLLFSTAENNIMRLETDSSLSIVYQYPSPSPTDPLLALNAPIGLAFHTNGDLYIADSGNHRIMRIPSGNLSTGNTTIARVSGNGTQGYSGNGAPALYSENRFNNPTALSFETKTTSNSNWLNPTEISAMTGDLLISDTGNHMIRQILEY